MVNKDIQDISDTDNAQIVHSNFQYVVLISFLNLELRKILHTVQLMLR